MKINDVVETGIVISSVACALSAPTQALSMTFVAIGAVSAVANYVFLSEVKKNKTPESVRGDKTSSKEFLKIRSREKINSATSEFKVLHSIQHKPVFRGDHKRQDEIEL